MKEYKGKGAQSPRRRAANAARRKHTPTAARTAAAFGGIRPVIGVGLMSGTSADGVDAAIVRLTPAPDGTRLRLLGFRTYPYPRGFRRFVLENSDRATAKLDQVSALDMLIGEFFADAALALAASLRIPADEIGFIGSHGQTISHLPRPVTLFGRRVTSTLQLGHPSVIAKRTGVLTVGDFRVGDVALGGEGAPLVPLCDHLIYRSRRINRAVLNIGGIANITILPRGCRTGRVAAFDTGPGNMIIDRLTERFYGLPCDRGGRIALAGKLIPSLLRRLAAHRFIARTPPKSTGREMFGEAFVSDILRECRGKRKEDIIATVTEFTALSVYRNCLLHVDRKDFPGEVIVSGGGVHNACLMEALRRYFHPARVIPAEETGIPSDAKEAVCFAILAWRTLRGETGNLPSVTGASRGTVLGVIAPP